VCVGIISSNPGRGGEELCAQAIAILGLRAICAKHNGFFVARARGGGVGIMILNPGRGGEEIFTQATAMLHHGALGDMCGAQWLCAGHNGYVRGAMVMCGAQ
jgi:hypothetical protein